MTGGGVPLRSKASYASGGFSVGSPGSGSRFSVVRDARCASCAVRGAARRTSGSRAVEIEVSSRRGPSLASESGVSVDASDIDRACADPGVERMGGVRRAPDSGCASCPARAGGGGEPSVEVRPGVRSDTPGSSVGDGSSADALVEGGSTRCSSGNSVAPEFVAVSVSSPVAESSVLCSGSGPLACCAPGPRGEWIIGVGGCVSGSCPGISLSCADGTSGPGTSASGAYHGVMIGCTCGAMPRARPANRVRKSLTRPSSPGSTVGAGRSWPEYPPRASHRRVPGYVLRSAAVWPAR